MGLARRTADGAVFREERDGTIRLPEAARSRHRARPPAAVGTLPRRMTGRTLFIRFGYEKALLKERFSPPLRGQVCCDN